jgi:hypothetical protein
MENRQYIVLYVLHSVTDSNYPCGIFKRLVNVLSVLPWVTDSNYPGRIFNLFVNVCLFSTGEIRICNWRENRQHIYQKFEDTTEVIRICNWRGNRQYIYQMFEDNHSGN